MIAYFDFSIILQRSNRLCDHICGVGVRPLGGRHSPEVCMRELCVYDIYYEDIIARYVILLS